MGTGKRDLGTAAFLLDVCDQGLDGVAPAEVLLGNLLIPWQYGLDAVDIDNPAALVTALYGAGGNLANALLVVPVDFRLLGIAQALDDDLLG